MNRFDLIEAYTLAGLFGLLSIGGIIGACLGNLMHIGTAVFAGWICAAMIIETKNEK